MPRAARIPPRRALPYPRCCDMNNSRTSSFRQFDRTVAGAVVGNDYFTLDPRAFSVAIAFAMQVPSVSCSLRHGKTTETSNGPGGAVWPAESRQLSDGLAHRRSIRQQSAGHSTSHADSGPAGY